MWVTTKFWFLVVAVATGGHEPGDAELKWQSEWRVMPSYEICQEAKAFKEVDLTRQDTYSYWHVICTRIIPPQLIEGVSEKKPV